jgi:hypothetical protein
LSGVRIICYFANQVDKVAEIIDSNFIVHPELSTDKRKVLDPDRFGYLSLHYVVELSEDRAKLQEYGKFKNLLCEVQMRSILQHAWAEIEHDLGYKSSMEIPREIRRRFCRLAGLLELADDEFEGIKEDITQYSEKVAAQITTTPEKILIDKVSLEHYLKSSPIVKEITKAIAHSINTSFQLDTIHYRPLDIETLGYFGIMNIDELDKVFKENKEKIIAFAREWLKPYKEDIFVDLGMPLFSLLHMMAGSTQNYDKVIKYIRVAKLSEFDSSYQGKLANMIIETYKKISG